MMKSAALSAVLPLVAVSVCIPAFATATSNGAASTAHQDTKFLRDANQSCVDQIALAQVVLQKSGNQDVQQFAQSVVSDQNLILNNMKHFDDMAGVPVPSAPDAATQAEKTKLEALSGTAFDKEYIKDMVADHHDALTSFMQEDKDTANSEFRATVEEGELTVRHQLYAIDHLADLNGVPSAPIPAGI